MAQSSSPDFNVFVALFFLCIFEYVYVCNFQIFVRQSSYPGQHQYPQGFGGVSMGGVIQQAHPYHHHMQYGSPGQPFTSQRPQRLPIDLADSSGMMDPYAYRQPPRYPYSAQTSPVQSPHAQVWPQSGNVRGTDA